MDNINIYYNQILYELAKVWDRILSSDNPCNGNPEDEAEIIKLQNKLTQLQAFDLQLSNLIEEGLFKHD